jgi:hypothetical protein
MTIFMDSKLGEHFTAREFQCHDRSPLPNSFDKTIQPTIEFLERLRGFMNFYIHSKTNVWKDMGLQVVSGYRNLAYNLKIGSTKTSQHVAGTAADVKPVGGYKYFSYRQFYKMCELVDKSFSTRVYSLGLYTRSKFVHVDSRKKAARWTGN